MKIQFNDIPETVIPEFKGGEKEFRARMHTDPKIKIMRGLLCPGASIGMHSHTTSSEVIFILSGCGKAICADKEEILQPGECHYCPKGGSHTLINDGDADLVFFAVVPEQ